jgi:hypothetical protein
MSAAIGAERVRPAVTRGGRRQRARHGKPAAAACHITVPTRTLGRRAGANCGYRTRAKNFFNLRRQIFLHKYFRARAMVKITMCVFAQNVLTNASVTSPDMVAVERNKICAAIAGNWRCSSSASILSVRPHDRGKDLSQRQAPLRHFRSGRGDALRARYDQYPLGRRSGRIPARLECAHRRIARSRRRAAGSHPLGNLQHLYPAVIAVGVGVAVAIPRDATTTLRPITVAYVPADSAAQPAAEQSAPDLKVAGISPVVSLAAARHQSAIEWAIVPAPLLLVSSLPPVDAPESVAPQPRMMAKAD